MKEIIHGQKISIFDLWPLTNWYFMRFYTHFFLFHLSFFYVFIWKQAFRLRKPKSLFLFNRIKIFWIYKMTKMSPKVWVNRSRTRWALRNNSEKSHNLLEIIIISIKILYKHLQASISNILCPIKYKYSKNGNHAIFINNYLINKEYVVILWNVIASKHFIE